MAFDHRVIFSKNTVELPGASLTVATTMLALITVLAASPTKAAAEEEATGSQHAFVSGYESSEPGPQFTLSVR